MTRSLCKCEHLSGIRVDQINTPFICLPIMGSKRSVLICKDCYKALKTHKKPKVVTQNRSKLRILTVAPGQFSDMFPEVILHTF